MPILNTMYSSTEWTKLNPYIQANARVYVPTKQILRPNLKNKSYHTTKLHAIASKIPRTVNRQCKTDLMLIGMGISLFVSTSSFKTFINKLMGYICNYFSLVLVNYFLYFNLYLEGWKHGSNSGYKMVCKTVGHRTYKIKYRPRWSSS